MDHRGTPRKHRTELRVPGAMSGLPESTAGGAASTAAWTPTRGRHRDRRRSFGFGIWLPGVMSKDIDAYRTRLVGRFARSRAGAGRSAAPDGEEPIASREERCGPGH